VPERSSATRPIWCRALEDFCVVPLCGSRFSVSMVFINWFERFVTSQDLGGHVALLAGFGFRVSSSCAPPEVDIHAVDTILHDDRKCVRGGGMDDNVSKSTALHTEVDAAPSFFVQRRG
jgi:hypothetical protein